jgi:hypothetical protein
MTTPKRSDITRRLFNGLALGTVALFTTGFGGIARELSPSADAWDRWDQHDPTSQQSLDHSAWTNFLNTFVVERPGVNLVRYGDVDQTASQQLDDYLAMLQSVPVSTLNRDQQFAFWLNLYNAQTIRIVLDHLPIKSIRDIDISPGLFADGPWDAALIKIEGESLTLNDIEHRILRPLWQDPRIHYAVNCASIGCPDLQPRAFTTPELQDQLDTAARVFINTQRGVTVDGDQVIISSLYDWFYEDFGGSDVALISHLKRYAGPALKERLEPVSKISGDRYDWSLNDAAWFE